MNPEPAVPTLHLTTDVADEPDVVTLELGALGPVDLWVSTARATRSDDRLRALQLELWRRFTSRSTLTIAAVTGKTLPRHTAPEERGISTSPN